MHACHVPRLHLEIKRRALQRSLHLHLTLRELPTPHEPADRQLRDLTFHFESQMKILQGGGDSELVGGEVSAPPPAQTPRGKRKAKVRGSGQ